LKTDRYTQLPFCLSGRQFDCSAIFVICATILGWNLWANGARILVNKLLDSCSA
jgi:hypothetical protein